MAGLARDERRHGVSAGFTVAGADTRYPTPRDDRLPDTRKAFGARGAVSATQQIYATHREDIRICSCPAKASRAAERRALAAPRWKIAMGHDTRLQQRHERNLVC